MNVISFQMAKNLAESLEYLISSLWLGFESSRDQSMEREDQIYQDFNFNAKKISSPLHFFSPFYLFFNLVASGGLY